jgi:hypothetical protein
MKRFITIVLALAVLGGIGLNQAKAEPKDFTKAKLEKATAKTEFGAVHYHGSYHGSYCSPCYRPYCSPCNTYCQPYSTWYSPDYSYYSHDSHDSHDFHRSRR